MTKEHFLKAKDLEREIEHSEVEVLLNAFRAELRHLKEQFERL